MVKMAWWNSLMPVGLWAIFNYWLDDSKRRTDAVEKVMAMHLIVWAPLVLVGTIVNMTGSLKGFAAFWLRHWSSNMY